MEKTRRSLAVAQSELAKHDSEALRPLSAILTWRGTTPEKYTLRAGKVTKARKQRKGQGAKLTYFKALGALFAEVSGISAAKQKKKASTDNDAEAYATLCAAAADRGKWTRLTRDC